MYCRYKFCDKLWICSLITGYHDYIVWFFFFLANVFSELWTYLICEMFRILVHVDWIEYEFIKEKNSSFKNLSMYAVLMKVSRNIGPRIEITLAN